jgi:hypothetical protein
MTMSVNRRIGTFFFGATLMVGATALSLVTATAQVSEDFADYVSAQEPPLFSEPSEVVDAFKAALAADDFDALTELLGLDAAKLRTNEGVMDNYDLIRAGAAKQLVVRDLGDHMVLEIGRILWPLPFPITKGDDGKWAFDTYAGIEEILSRRVGENEIQAMATARAYVDGQRDYASEDRDADGVLEYAQNIVSSEGQTDGLYWPPDQGDGDSPAGAFVNETALDKAAQGDGYYGYRFRILTAQGANIAGGSYDYVINGNMIAGFALIAWPVSYGETGVNTFVVNHQGIVYEADLGENTEVVAREIDRFNPDDNWNVSEATN